MNTDKETATDPTVKIKILGPGCANCRRLEANAHQAVRQMGVEADLEKVEDIGDIMAYGILRTPGLVVNDQVVVSGRVPSVPEIVSLLGGKL